MSHDPVIEYKSPVFLRLALGFVYFHFGLLKFFPDLSPAELIGTQTVMSVSQHWLDAHGALVCLAVLETALGLAFLFNVFPKITL
ncbi:MAG: DoxX family membrane protein, partial [Pirellulales bacterium]